MSLSSLFNTVLLTILLNSGGALFAQDLQIIESIYLEKDQGLNERTINHTQRDSKGYFYFFSSNSIQRFDGQSFEDVHTNILSQLNENLTDLLTVQKNEKEIWLKFKSGQEAYIKEGGLDLIKKTHKRQLKLSSLDNSRLELDKLSLTIGETKYTWTVGQLEISTKSITKTIDIQSEGKPKFIRQDNKGNLIAAYSSRPNYVDNYYVLDTLGDLHDFTLIADTYETAKDIYTDDAFYKWMLCGHNGVKILTLKRSGVEFILYDPNVPKGQFGKVFSGISSTESALLLATETGQLYNYDPESNTTSIFNENFAFVSNGLGKMLKGSKKEINILKGQGGDLTDLYFINSASKQIDEIHIEGSFRDYILKSNGDIILAGQSADNKGLILIYNHTTKKSQKLNINLPSIRAIFQDKKTKEYYIGTKKGLYICDENFTIKSKFNLDQSKERYIYHEDILFTYAYANHIVAGSNGGGVYIIDPKSQTIVRHFNHRNGFSDDIAISAITDDSNRLWIATFNGLNVIDSTLNVIKNIYKFDGLPNREFNSFAVAKHKGDLYFGTINGAIRLNPEKVLNWDYSYKISLENIKAYTKKGVREIKINTTYINLNEPDSIDINYTVTDYFKYPYNYSKINAHSQNKDVKINHQKNLIRVKGLREGLNRLNLKLDPLNEIRQLNLDNKKDYTIWKNFALWIISIICLSALIIHFSINYIKAKAKVKTAQHKKISELQLSALQGQMNPHFIFNALGAIQYFIQTNDVNKADDYLSDFALLMRGILDSSSKKFITLKEELKLLNLYVGLEKARFEDKFDVNFEVNDNIDDETLIPPMIIQPYIENAVNHGLHHLKGKKGSLDIKIDYKADLLIITIEDNGIGREAAQKLRGKANHVSRAMSITKERVQTINKSSEIQVTINVVDLKDTNDKAIGTRVLIQIKD